MNVDLATGEKRPHPLVGTVVEPYAILDVIAAGGMGVVFKARHMLTDRIVAMKLLPSELARDESNVQRVKLEAKALAQLNHPNIVTTFDFGFTYMQEPFIVMEYVAGQSLKEVLDREVLLPVDRAIKIFLQAVDGMRYAHSAKILHRDLKPHNIMVSEEPEPDHVKILDFGVAKFAEYTQQITRTGEVVGSPLYMSPEQCTGRPTDHRCDIYSIGVMMFETLTGNPPFRGENYISTVHLKCTKLAPNFKDVVPGRVFPDRLETIVLKCLEIEPDKRYANMAELRADLELVAGGVPKVERPKTSQNLGNLAKVSEQSKIASSPGPGEIGWKPAWSGNNAPNMVSRAAADDWSDSIVTGIETDAWQSPGGGKNLASSNTPPGFAPHANNPMSAPSPQGSASSGTPSDRQPSASQNMPQAFNQGSADPYDTVGPGRTVDTWRDSSSPSVTDDSWRGPSSPNLSADDWNSLDQTRNSTGLTGQWPQTPVPQTPIPPPPVPQPPRLTEPPPMVAQTPRSANAQDMASLSAALEASSVSGPSMVGSPHHNQLPGPQTQPTGAQSQLDTGDHPTIQVGSSTVPVPTPNKDAADSHFVLTWDSKSGPAWSATTATPQKPRGPSPLATNTRNPIQLQSHERSVGGQPGQQAIAQSPKPLSEPASHKPQSVTPPATPGSHSLSETDQKTPSEPAWAQAPPSGVQPPVFDGTASGVVNPASAYGWRPANAEPDSGPSVNGTDSRPRQNFASPQSPHGFPNSSAQGFTLPSQHGQGFTSGAVANTGQQIGSASSPQDSQGHYKPAGPNPQAIPPQALKSAVPPGSVPLSPANQGSAGQIQVPGSVNNDSPRFEELTPDQSRNTGSGEPDPWAEVPSFNPNTNIANLTPSGSATVPPPSGPPQNAVATASPAPHFNSPPSPWGPQPVPLDFLKEDKTVAVAKPTGQPAQSPFSPGPPNHPAEVSVVNNPVIPPSPPAQPSQPRPGLNSPVQPPPFADKPSSPIQELAQRMAESMARVEDSVEDHHYGADDNGGPEFKNYEPVSLAELNAIKTPTAKALKPIADSGLSNILPATPTPAPLPPQKRNRSDDDTEYGARSAALRFNSSRGGNDGKKVVMMSLSGVAILIIIAIIGFKVFKYYETGPQQATNEGSPANVAQPDRTVQTPPNTSPTNAPNTHDTTDNTTTSAAEKPTKSAQRSQTATSTTKKKAVAIKVKKLKKPKAVAKAPAPSTDVPATVKHRRAYSTYDSYYGN